jgi:hypothetical protein
MDAKSLLSPIVNGINAGASALSKAPVVGSLVGRAITDISYVGRKSGRTFTTPVGYRRSGDEITIHVALPDRKSWWRNFLGDGGPITIRLDGLDRSGHAVAHRDDKGRVSVAIRLTPR